MKRKEQPKNKSKSLEVTHVIDEVKNSVAGLEDKVDEINQEIEQKRQQSWAWWFTPVIPTLLEAEVGGSPEVRSLKSAWATW